MGHRGRGIRLLHVIGASEYGGGVIVISSLVRVARQLGWQVDVLATAPAVQNALRKDGAGVVELDVVQRDIRPHRDARDVWRLCRFLRSSDYTAVHTHTSKGGFLGRLAARLAGVPVIVHTAHGFAFHERSNAATLRFYVTLERLAAHWCDRIVTVSEFHRCWALKLGIGNARLVTAIANGISPQRVAPTRPIEAKRAELGWEPGQFTALSTGRLAEGKGLQQLIEATAALNLRFGFALTVWIAGEGPQGAALQEQARRLGVRERVRFLGFRHDLGDLLAACDMVVLPSWREGLSIALLEAMAAGKPIVATTIGSNAEAIQHGEAGWLVPPMRADTLAEAMLSLAQDGELRQRLGTEAQRVYQQRYTEQRMMAAYAALYQGLRREKGIAVPQGARESEPGFRTPPGQA